MKIYLVLILNLLCLFVYAQQHISNFTSVQPSSQNENFNLPLNYSFHFILKEGDTLTDGNTMPTNPDFTGYIPIANSSTHGYLCINSEANPGGVTVLEIELNNTTKKWDIISSKKVNFSQVNGTRSNCSGAVTPWGTMLTCEETTSSDLNFDGYNDHGWVIEINPSTPAVINQPGGLANADKLWALGNFAHENASVHTNKKTVYMGADAATGYLFKFVADTAEKLYAGKLYAYKGSKSGNGKWVRIKNSTASDCNNVNQRCADSSCTSFSGIEDVEYNSIDGKVYLAVKGENRVYRFTDDAPLNGDSIHNFETYVGNASYTITYTNGSSITAWGTGNDNLCFDDTGNLWVFQDGSDNHIWMVSKGHTQASPKVKLFARTPAGSEPTGITFTPDYQYMFMSLQHPSSSNSTTQNDAFGSSVKFDKAVSLVLSRDTNFIVLPIQFNNIWGKNVDQMNYINWQTACEHLSYGFFIERSRDHINWSNIGLELSANKGCQLTNYSYTDKTPHDGLNYYRIRQTDYDGSEFISETIVLNCLYNNITVSPNPCHTGSLFEIGSENGIQLYDSMGKRIKFNCIFQNSKLMMIAPDISGVYYILKENGTTAKLVVY